MNSILAIVILKLHASSKRVLKLFETPLNTFKVIDLSSSLVLFLKKNFYILEFGFSSVAFSGDKIKKLYGARSDKTEGYKEQR